MLREGPAMGWWLIQGCTWQLGQAPVASPWPRKGRSYKLTLHQCEFVRASVTNIPFSSAAFQVSVEVLNFRFSFLFIFRILEKIRFTTFLEPQEPCFSHDCPPGSAFHANEDRCTYRTVLIPCVSDCFPDFSGRNMEWVNACRGNWTFNIYFVIQENIQNECFLRIFTSPMRTFRLGQTVDLSPPLTPWRQTRL